VRPLSPMHALDDPAAAAMRHSWFLWMLRSLAILLAVLRLVLSPETFNADGVSYLDISDEFLRLRLPLDALEYWSPLYPGLIAIVRQLPVTELVAIRVLNLFIFVAAMIGFERFMHSAATDRSWSGIWRFVFTGLGYGIFIWSTLSLIRVENVTPDMIVFAVTCYAASHLQKTMSGSRRAGVSFGLVLALGYFAKAIMFPVGLLFCAAAFFCSSSPGRRTSLLATTTFLLAAAPLFLLLSFHAGRLTSGSSGRLNYAWYVEGVTRWIHWQGDPLHGEALQPTKLIFRNPPAYSFAEPFTHATYSPWFAPSYWHRGLQLRVDLERQLRATGENLSSLREIFGPVAIALLLIVIGALPSMRRLGRYRYALLAVASLTITLYTLVYVEARFISPAITLIAVSLVSCVDTSSGLSRRRMIFAAFVAAAVIMVAAPINELIERQIMPDTRASREQSLVELLRRHGTHSGLRVAVIGDGIDASWARRCDLRIIAEVPLSGVSAFARAPEQTQRALLAAFAAAGAELVVADVSARPRSAGWIATSDGGFFIRKLQNDSYSTSIKKAFPRHGGFVTERRSALHLNRSID